MLYPRTASLGGCTAHNALVTIYPDESDFQYIADLTNDTSWSPANMRNYWVKLEQNRYRPAGEAGHGYSGWLGVETADINIAYRDPQLLGMVLGGASALSTDPNAGLQTLLNGDANAPGTTRDQTQATYQIPIATKQGARNGAREFVLSVAGATNADGSKKYPLDVRLNCLVTKVTFSNNTTQGQPQATGVQFLDGTALYRADPRSTKNSNSGTPGSATATREVIISGGSYNSPQILKLSGIGPAAELRNLSIPVLVDLPGVGANLQDHYEVTVQAALASNFSTLNNCTLAFNPDGTQAPAANDPCYQKWLSAGPGGDRGPYASNGFASAMFLKSSAASAVDNNFGVLAFGGPVDFRGYFPGYSSNATQAHNHWSWALLKAHPRNTAGSVTLRSADPRDTPSIVFNYFDTGNGDSAKDVAQLVEAIGVARQAIKGQTVPYEEVLPGPQFGGDLAAYVRNTAWGHHCSSTCAIGKDGDSMAVLDSSFRVRGVKGLRVVDASVYPRIPGKPEVSGMKNSTLLTMIGHHRNVHGRVDISRRGKGGRRHLESAAELDMIPGDLNVSRSRQAMEY